MDAERETPPNYTEYWKRRALLAERALLGVHKIVVPLAKGIEELKGREIRYQLKQEILLKQKEEAS